MSVRVRRFRLIVETCSTKLDKCRFAFGEVGIVSALVRRCWVSVGTCPEKSA